MESIAQALQLIIDLAQKAKGPSILQAPEPNGRYYLVGPDGQAELQTAHPTFHNETIATPEELARFAKDRNAAATDGAIFYSEDAVVLVQDLKDRRDRAVCPLILSPQYQWLAKGSNSAMTQTQFVRLLRITFNGCVPQDSNLLTLLRALKFSASSEGGATIQHGRESMGKQIDAQVNAASTLPDEVVLSLAVFDNFAFRSVVPCAIEIMPQEQQFRLTPYPQKLRAAMDSTLAVIAEVFDGGELPPIYRGQP